MVELPNLGGNFRHKRAKGPPGFWAEPCLGRTCFTGQTHFTAGRYRQGQGGQGSARQQVVNKVIISGGNDQLPYYSEAIRGMSVFTENGIQEDDIILEVRASTISEAIWFSLSRLPENTDEFHVITSDFYIPRTKYIVEETLRHFHAIVGSVCLRLTVVLHEVKSHCDVSGGATGETLAGLAEFERDSLDPNKYPRNVDDDLGIWPLKVKVDDARLRKAWAQAETKVEELRECTGPLQPSTGGSSELERHALDDFWSHVKWSPVGSKLDECTPCNTSPLCGRPNVDAAR